MCRSKSMVVYCSGNCKKYDPERKIAISCQTYHQECARNCDYKRIYTRIDPEVIANARKGIDYDPATYNDSWQIVKTERYVPNDRSSGWTTYSDQGTEASYRKCVRDRC